MPTPSQQSSVQERVLQRVMDVLQSAGSSAGSRVYRGRVDPFSIDELPAANLRRSTSLNDAHVTGIDRGVLEFEIDNLVEGDDWETGADTLHVQLHAAIANDDTLAGLCKGLRCIRAEPRAQAGDTVRGALTATYQIQALHAVADLSFKP